MATSLLIARLLLAAVFVAAAVAKFADQKGARRTMLDFGAPAEVAPLLGFLIPVLELLAALLLLGRSTAWLGALDALALLAVFTAAVGIMLARGKAPACRCFGQLSSKPVSWKTIARNGGLATVASVIGSGGRDHAGPGVLDWAGDLSRPEGITVLVGVTVLALGTFTLWLLVQLIAQNGRLLLRVESLEMAVAAPREEELPSGGGLEPGTVAPEFELETVGGGPMSLAALRARGRPVMLVFSDPGCGPCDALMPDIGRWQGQPDHATVAVVSRGTVEQNLAKVQQHRLAEVLVADQTDVAARYSAIATPSAVVVLSDGKIGSQVAQGPGQIRGLMARLQGERPAALPMGVRLQNIEGMLSRVLMPHGGGHQQAPRAPSGLDSGTEAPEFELPALNGGRTKLADFRGKPVLLIFFNPDCSFCREMAPKLAALPIGGENGTPVPLVVTTGDVAANRKLMKEFGIGCPVLRQKQMEVAALYHTGGTPTGYLIDRDGRIASPLAAGADALLALAPSS